jgi:pyruvate,water dikinase
MERIITLSSGSSENVLAIVGGKGGNLLKLSEKGAEVPPFVVLSSHCFEAFLSSFQAAFRAQVGKLDCSSPQTIAESARELRELIQRQPLPEELANELFLKLPQGAVGDSFYAVRSSALGEDSKEFSYAGMLDTYLFCKTREEISQAIIKCWASIFSDRAVAYRHMRNIDQGTVSMAVVVQTMIDGQISGVTFTVNPTTKYRDEILINAVYGLGEGLVSGALNADQFITLKGSGYPVSERTIVEKYERVIFDRAAGSGTIEEKLDAETAKRCCISDSQVSQVSAACHRIEQGYLDVPQDIEWTIDYQNKLWILQARPITTIERPYVQEREYKTLWDNSNIVESYSGITTPLTFSFALDAYHNVYVQFCQVLGVPEEKIRKNDFAFANMLGLLNGRVYYNLKNWYRLVSVLPGYSYNSRFMEGMMGVKAKFEINLDEPEQGFFDKYIIGIPRLAWVGFNLCRQFYTIDSRVKDFMGIYQRMYDKYKDFDFDQAPAHKCVDVYNELVATVLANWKAPIINDFMAMIFYGILKSLIKSWNLDADGSLQNDLMAGQGDVESTLPMKTLQKMARYIQARPALLETFRKKTPGELRTMFIRRPGTEDSSESAEMCQMVTRYLDEYGYRSMNELKLEEPPLQDNPEFIFSMLKNYSGSKLPPEEDTSEKERKVREDAERKVAEALRGQKLFGFLPKTRVLMFVADYAKKAVKFREYQRFARTKMYGMARRLFMGIGQRFVERGLLAEVNDVFFLTKQEVISYVVGCACSQKIRELAALRKAEYAEYAAQEDLPDRIETTGIVYQNDLTRSAIKIEQPDDPNILVGIGGCSGVVRGRVKVILNPSDDMSLNGEILVASKTDPGWVPLFATASGLLIERGSMLSHSVIVARELGLPAIVGITGITKRLKSGDLVEMDGKAGIVKILERAAVE